MKYTVNSDLNAYVFDHEELSQLDIIKVSDKEFHLIEDDVCYKYRIHTIDLRNNKVSLEMKEDLYEFEISTPLDMLIKEMGMNASQSNTQKEVKAPMPGLILEILVEVGQKVEKDDSLLILEAMKMENILKAEGEGVIKEIKMKKGDSVDKHQVLIELE